MRRRWIILLLAGLSLALAPAARSAQPVQAYPANAAQTPDPAPEYVPGELILGLKDDVELRALSLPQGMRAAAVSSELAPLQAALVRVPPGQEETYRKKLVNQPGVLFAEPNYIVSAILIPNDPLYEQQWGLPEVGAPAAWDITTGSTAVTVAVIDSGIDPGHPEFAGRLLAGYDFVRNTDSLTDPCGHGTHVTGIIAASGNNGIGIAGVDWQAKILPLRVLDDYCDGTVANIARALVYAVDHHGAQVINLSLGLASPSRLLENATHYAYRRGAALIAAAGNGGCSSGGSHSNVFYPARYPWTLAVSAVSAVDSSLVPAVFSSCGPEVDLAAPGVAVLSTFPRMGSSFYTGLPNSYASLSGTSMAAPFAAGAAALLASRGFDHPDAIYTALSASARDIGDPGFDNKTGTGLLQIDAALAQSPIPPIDPPPAVVEYDLLSSSRCQNIQYNWRNISHAGGNQIFIPGVNSYTSVTLPFSFNFGGQTFNQITVSANGYLSFDDAPVGQRLQTYGQPINFLIPQPVILPNHFLAAFWDDLNPSANTVSGGIYHTPNGIGAAPNREYVVEWQRIPIQLNNRTTEVTFQIILLEDSNHIQYQYHTLTGPESDGSSATIGLEYSGGSRGLLYTYNQRGAVRNRSAIHFYPHSPGSERTTPGCQITRPTGPGGGSYQADPFCLDIPAGMLDRDATLRISTFTHFAATPAHYLPLGAYAEITLDPKPTPPLTPAPRVCYRYTAADLVKVGGRPENLHFAVYTPETQFWQRLATTVDRQTRRIYTDVPHFSIVGVFYTPMPETPPVTGARLPAVPVEWLLAALGWAGTLWIWRSLRSRRG